MYKNLDANASFGLHPLVQTALLKFLPKLRSDLLNPSSVHQGGQAAKLVLDTARDEVRALVGAAQEDLVIFTSGATEANNQAVLAPFWGLESIRDLDRSNFTLVTTCVEHESVADAAQRVASLGFSVRVAKPAKFQSWLTADDILSLVTSQTKVLSVIHGQNEIGTMVPVADVALAARRISPQLFIHSDTVQSIGRVPLSLASLGVDAISVSAHKLGGLSGIGALVVRASAKAQMAPLLVGGAQEGRLRSGTENVLGIYSLGIAARIAREDVSRGARMACARAILKAALLEKIPSLVIQGEFTDGNFIGEKLTEHATRPDFLPNTLCVTLPQQSSLRADDLVVALDLHGIRISTGSACSSGKQEGNKTLRALGYPEPVVSGSIRISMTGDESEGDLVSVANVVSFVVSRSLPGYSQLHRSEAYA